MNLEYVPFKDIDLSDPFFGSLKSDYQEFEEWFQKKSDHQAYIFKNHNGLIDGFLYLKCENEAVEDVQPMLQATKRLKVGTFKINAHGTRLGERFIKKVFDHAVHESVKEIYVTVFPHHKPLIQLFEKYGFEHQATKTTQNGTELVLVKSMVLNHGDVVKDYPLIKLSGKKRYLLSLYPEWHTRLLPDSILKTEDSDILTDISHTNSIHKVYLTAMRGTRELTRGDVLVIYRTGDGFGPAHYRAVATSVCIVEEVRNINEFRTEQDFIDYCSPYSVFTTAELKIFYATRKYPIVIRFTYNVALKKRVTRGVMIEELGMDGNQRWGFIPLAESEFKGIISRGKVSEDLIIY